jgi:hypothetical protein
LVARTAGRDEVAGLISAATGLGSDVIQSQVVVRSAVRASITPGGLDVLAPEALGFRGSHDNELLEVVVWGRQGGHEKWQEGYFFLGKPFFILA